MFLSVVPKSRKVRNVKSGEVEENTGSSKHEVGLLWIEQDEEIETK